MTDLTDRWERDRWRLTVERACLEWERLWTQDQETGHDEATTAAGSRTDPDPDEDTRTGLLRASVDPDAIQVMTDPDLWSW